MSKINAEIMYNYSTTEGSDDWQLGKWQAGLRVLPEVPKVDCYFSLATTVIRQALSSNQPHIQ